MDIVIPTIRHDVHNHAELRYTLRSIEKYLTGYDQVILVGYQPKWCTNLLNLIANDNTPHPNVNIKDKLMRVCKTKVSDNFLYMNDDHILTTKVDARVYPYYYECKMIERIYKKEQTAYNKLISYTWEAIMPKQPVLFFDVHTPLMINKFLFRHIMQRYDWSKKTYLVKSLYCNNLELDGEIMPIKDIKIIRPVREKAKWQEIIKNNPVVSTDSGAIDNLFYEVMEEMFPERSRFEKTSAFI